MCKQKAPLALQLCDVLFSNKMSWHLNPHHCCHKQHGKAQNGGRAGSFVGVACICGRVWNGLGAGRHPIIGQGFASRF